MWPYSACSAAIASSDATRSCSDSPMPTRIPLVNGIRSSPAARIVSRRRAGCLVGEPACTVCISRSEIDSSISPCEAVTSRSRARSSRESTPRFVCGSRPRSSARSQRPHDVGREVLVAVLAPGARRTCGLTSGRSPVSTSSSLTCAARRAVEDLDHLLGRVQVRLVRRERAVLAVALARARQRQRQVAREGDSATHGGSL